MSIGHVSLGMKHESAFAAAELITRPQNFRLVQIETNCRQHFEVYLKWKISTIKGRNHCEKRRNKLLVTSNFFFSHNVCHSYISFVHQNAALFGNWLTQSRLLTTLKEKAFENIVGRGENAGNQHFLLFP